MTTTPRLDAARLAYRTRDWTRVHVGDDAPECAHCGVTVAPTWDSYHGGTPCGACDHCPMCGSEWDETLDMCADEAADEQLDVAHTLGAL